MSSEFRRNWSAIPELNISSTLVNLVMEVNYPSNCRQMLIVNNRHFRLTISLTQWSGCQAQAQSNNRPTSAARRYPLSVPVPCHLNTTTPQPSSRKSLLHHKTTATSNSLKLVTFNNFHGLANCCCFHWPRTQGSLLRCGIFITIIKTMKQTSKCYEQSGT